MGTWYTEYGTITLPAKEWATFRKDLLTKWNARLETTLAKAQAAHKAAKDAGKGKRGSNRYDAMYAAVAKVCNGTLDKYGNFNPNRKYNYQWGGYDYDNDAEYAYDAVCRLVFKVEGWDKDRKVTLQAPKKSAMDFKAVTKDATLRLPDAVVTFRNKTRTVVWNVPRAKNATERARQHWFAQELFKALGKVTWTRNSGGEIVGTDENTQYEGRYHAGGGGSYVTATYPKAKQEADQKAQAAARRRPYYARHW